MIKITKNIVYEYSGKQEWVGKEGNSTVSWIHKIENHFYPIVRLSSNKSSAGRALPNIKAAMAWILMRLTENKNGLLFSK